MDNDFIKNINIGELKENSYLIDYVDDDLVTADNLDAILGKNSAVRLNFCLLVFCPEGRIQMDINNQSYNLQKDNFLMILPSSIVSGLMLSNTNQVRVIGVSPSFLNEIVKGEKNISSIIDYLRLAPLRHFSEEQEAERIYLYYSKLIANKVNGTNPNFRRRIVMFLFSALFCEVLSNIDAIPPLLGKTPESGCENQSVLRVYKRFMKELAHGDGRHRSVSYYADLICYSPKYLSYAVKLMSGRTAMDWINEHTMNQIKFQLRTSDKSIKEIAEMFNFPNISFFGKYVKRNTGLSPKQYRESGE